MDKRSVSPEQTARRGALWFVLFWLYVGAMLYFFFNWLESRERSKIEPYTISTGELVIPRHRDGHFYVSGEINHYAVWFMVDTGATSVSITEKQRVAANLPEGMRIRLQSASGEHEGGLIHHVPVKVGHLTMNDVSVVTGLSELPGDVALLGQSFLRHFDVEMRRDEMILRSPSP